MSKKLKLAKAVVLSLMCASLTNGVAVASHLVVSDNKILSGSELQSTISIDILPSGDLTIKEDIFDFYADECVVENKGKLTIKRAVLNTAYPEDTTFQWINGDIKHDSGAVTNIVLNGYNPGDPDLIASNFTGNIIGSNSNFSLVLEENSIWEPHNQEGAVEGVALNGGIIDICHENGWVQQINHKPVAPWSADYQRLRLKNFKTNGDGEFMVSTDLFANKGDRIDFVGSTPNKNINLDIINKDGKNGEVAKKEDGYSVTVVTAPVDTNMNVNATLRFYDNYGAKLMDPILEIATDDDLKMWNFVGWTVSPKNRTFNVEKQIQAIDNYVNVRDSEVALKRLDDLRADPGEVGVWMRGERGKSKIHDYSYDYNLMSGGYDWHKDNDARSLFYGFGITYSTNNCNDGVIGDAKGIGYNVYGSWIGKRHTDYVDVVMKYGNLKKDYSGNDLNDVHVSGHYKKNMFSMSTKYGRRFQVKDGWYVEPNVAYTYGYISDADYTDNQDTRIHADAQKSHIMNLGVRTGKNIKGTEVYSKLAYVYDFGGKVNVSSDFASAHDDMGGGYVRLGLGASRKVGKNNSFYCDIEKDFGSKVKKPYAVSLGYRHTF